MDYNVKIEWQQIRNMSWNVQQHQNTELQKNESQCLSIFLNGVKSSIVFSSQVQQAIILFDTLGGGFVFSLQRCWFIGLLCVRLILIMGQVNLNNTCCLWLRVNSPLKRHIWISLMPLLWPEAPRLNLQHVPSGRQTNIQQSKAECGEQKERKEMMGLVHNESSFKWICP